MESLIHFPFPSAVTIILAISTCLTLFFWIRLENAEHKKMRKLLTTSLFHCLHCEKLYEVRGDTEAADCPDCNKNNLRLRF